MPELSDQQLCGQDDRHVSEQIEGAPLHPAAARAFRAMQSAAEQDGISLNVASGFRSYDRQKQIWNRKFAALAEPVSLQSLHEILRWSALPGASRHHWGCELDVYDKSGFTESELQLIPEEYATGGPCHALNCWLDEHAAEFSFFRPYDRDRGGVSPEPWHLSYYPVADACMAQFSVEILRQAIQNEPIQGQELVLSHLENLFQRYVQRVGEP